MIGLPETLTIARLGARGDGVALREGAPVHVGYALPGEVVRVAVQGERGRLIAVDTPSLSGASRSARCSAAAAAARCSISRKSPTGRGSAISLSRRSHAPAWRLRSGRSSTRMARVAGVSSCMCGASRARSVPAS